MADSSNLSCSFCGKARDSVEKLIAGPHVYICNECIELSYQIVSSEKPEKPAEAKTEVPTPRNIKEQLDQYIIGQDDVKEVLSVSAYNHYKRIYNDSDAYIEKSNVLLIGPTGTGKTLFAKTLGTILNVPFVIADATSLTESGYMGEDAESVLERLLSSANYDIELAQRGIVYIDEIDKKAKRFDSGATVRDVSGEGVQQALLRLIEGASVKIKTSSSKKFQEETVEFDTSNVLFVVSGAFVGIDETVSKRVSNGNTIGFNSQVRDNKESIITAQDVINYGIIPELMGRLPIIGVLNELTHTDLIHVLGNVKNSILGQFVSLFEMDGIELAMTPDFLNDCADLAVKQKLGARALRQIVENSLQSLMYRAPDLHNDGVVKIILDKYPRASQLPTLVYKNGKIAPDTNYKPYRGIHE